MQDGEPCVFDLEELREYIDLSSFRFMLVAVSEDKIAVATSRYLVIMEEDGVIAANDEGDEERDKVQTVVEFGQTSGRPTAIQWITSDTLCVGFESGAMTCFNDFGETVSENEFSTSALVSIRVLPNPDPAVSGQVVWALYESGYLISVSVGHLLGGTALGRYYLKFKLMDRDMVSDFAVLPSMHMSSIFEADNSSPGASSSFMVCGVDPALSLYTIGGKQQLQHLGKLASFVRDKVGTAISKTVGNALVSFFGSGSTGTEGPDEDDHTAVTAVMEFNESEKRRILRLSISPGGKLLAAADSLGRVLLFDCRLGTTVIRVWKGVREARFAWTEDRQQSQSLDGVSEGKSRRILCLAIYAPQTGLLSLWALRHGPCLRSIPVGPQCHIHTAFYSNGIDRDALSRCALLRVTNGNRLSLSMVSPFGFSEEDLDLEEVERQESGELEGDGRSSMDTDEGMDAHSVSGAMSTSRGGLVVDHSRVLASIERTLLPLTKKPCHLRTGADMRAVEHRVWMTMSALRDIGVVCRAVSAIEQCERDLYNSTFTSSAVCSPSQDSISFSSQFHRNISRLLEEGVVANSGSPDTYEGRRRRRSSTGSLGNALYVTGRGRLVKAYELLVEINSQVSLASLAASPPPGTEHNKWAKQNSARAEAICWAARRLVPSTGHTHASGARTPPIVSAPVLVRGKSRNSNASVQDGGGESLRSSSPYGSPRTSFSSLPVDASGSNRTPPPPISTSPPAPGSGTGRSSASVSPHNASFQTALRRTTPGHPPFSTFLLFHTPSHSSSHSHTEFDFQYDAFVTLLDMAEGYSVTDMLTREVEYTAVEGPVPTTDTKIDVAGQLTHEHIVRTTPPVVAQELLNFMFVPLMGDVFALQRFVSAIDVMGLGGGQGLQKALPLVMSFMESQPMGTVFNALVNRQLSSSPLQRWLRDTLLSFQSVVAGDEDDHSEHSGDGTSLPLPRSDRTELARLLSEVMTARGASASVLLMEEEGEPPTPPTLDEIVRHILRPAWLHARKSLHLECTMIIAAQILEVLEGVGAQIERRTFGEVNLDSTKLAWETLIRQLRVTLLLSSRAGGKLSVDSLGSGDISIYSLLAADTLCFAMQADQAAEHELRCQEVYTRRAARPVSIESGPGSSTDSRDSESGALLAWGPHADARWKELVTVAEAEDAFMQEATAAQSQSSSPTNFKPRSPSQTKSKMMAGGNKKIRRRRPLLLFFPSHNQSAQLGAYRAFALADRWCRRPKRVEILALAGAHLLPIPPVTRAAVAERILLSVVFPLLRPYLDLEEGKLHKKNATDATQELVIVMADHDLVESFVQSSIELITFALQGGSGDRAFPSSVDADGTNDTKTSREKQLQADELNPEVWPPTSDARLNAMVRTFQSQGGICENAAKFHMCLLWVLQLRTQCGLRGVKISELFGGRVLRSMCIPGALSLSNFTWHDVNTPHRASDDPHENAVTSSGHMHVDNIVDKWSRSSNDGRTYSIRTPSFSSTVSDEATSLKAVREEFMLQCFRRLEAQSSNIVYSIAEIWDIDNKQARLVHLTTLLELGHDDIIAELVSHFDDWSVAADRITQGIRIRIGTTIACIERIPACGPLLASLDPEAAAWVRESVGQPDRATVEGIMKGEVRVVNFDVPSSRHLVIRVQALLFGVPITQRNGRWTEKKNKCDALLSLCSALSESEVQLQLKGSGLLL